MTSAIAVGDSSLEPPARVYLLPPERVVNPLPHLARACFEQLQSGFALQAATSHTPADDAETAEVILAPIQAGAYGRCLERLRRSPICRHFGQKLVVYCPDDNQFPALRGLYPAITRRWVESGWALPAHYVSSHIHKFRFQPAELEDKDILFSFVGSTRTHPVREQIFALKHPRGVLIDAAAEAGRYWWESASRDALFARFRDVTRRSRFVICPRGISPSSIRLFEAMEAGAVPVIVADDLELPQGPAWEKFSIRVPQRAVQDIPAAVEALLERAEEMGRAARLAWEAYFSEPATLATLVAWARQLLRHPRRQPLRLRAAEYLSLSRLRAKWRCGTL